MLRRFLCYTAPLVCGELFEEFIFAPNPPDESGQAFPKNRDVPKGEVFEQLAFSSSLIKLKTALIYIRMSKIRRVHFKFSLAGGNTSQGNQPWSVSSPVTALKQKRKFEMHPIRHQKIRHQTFLPPFCRPFFYSIIFGFIKQLYLFS